MNKYTHLLFYSSLKLIVLVSCSLGFFFKPFPVYAGFDCPLDNAYHVISTSECVALKQFYEAMDGPNWIDNLWVNGAYCDSKHIWCSYDSEKEIHHVEKLYLSDVGLKGELPAAVFSNLPYLKEIALKGAISGTIPSTIATPLLEDLGLADNQLTGPIPVELASLPKLREVGFANNQLSGSIPEGLLGDQWDAGNTTKLGVISLTGNMLSGTLPNNVGTQRISSILVAQNADLSGAIPSAYAQLSSLKYFRFSGTKVCEPQDQVMQSWLQSLSSVSRTGISCDDPPEPVPSFELTYPAGLSPKVFTNGWVFGAKVSYDDSNGNTVDISEQVSWQGTGNFSPTTGSRSYPVFSAEGQNTIKLSVTIGGKIFSKEYKVDAVSSRDYAKVSDQAKNPTDGHGCISCPHSAQGPIITGSLNVSIDGLPAARVGDAGVHSSCCGPNSFTIKTGDENVLIDGRPAARVGDITTHCGGSGRIITGSLKKDSAVAKQCRIHPDTLPKLTGGTISGTVTDSTLNGIHGVGVTAYGETILDVWGAITDENGEYQISGLPDDTFRIFFWGGNVAYNDGYISSWYNGKASMSVAEGITISGANSISGINGTLSAGGTISGTVTDEHGGVIQGIAVGAYGDSGNNAWGYTDENGRYTIGGLSSDSYKLQCVGGNKGYVSEWYNNTSSQVSATPVIVSAPAQRKDIDCTLTTAGTITGTVTDGAKKSIANVYVKAFGQSTGATGLGVTDMNGKFTISGISGDSYRVQFDGTSSGYQHMWYDSEIGWDGAKLVPVTISQETSNIDAQLKKAGAGFSWPTFLPAITRPRSSESH